MAKSAKQILHGLQRLYFHEIPSSKSLIQTPISHGQSGSLNSFHHHQLSNLCKKRSFSTQIPPRTSILLPKFPTQTPAKSFPRGLFPSGYSTSRNFRFFSSGRLESGIVKSAIRDPISSAKSVAARYRQAVGLQAEAFWNRNYLILVGAGAVVVCIALWRIMFGVASTFVGLSEGMAKYGFLALASAIVAFTGMYIRGRLTINPDKVYKLAMRKLNTSAGILEVMGAPLTGTDLRAYIMSGGGPKLKDFKFRIGGKRCFLIFPIRGSERRGLVSVEAKKKKGQYDIRLLAVDIPMAVGPDQRLFLIGDEEEYKVGGGLISELRDPIVKAMAAEKEFEKLDEQEEKEDELREREEAERKQREEEDEELEAEKRRQEYERLEKGGS